MFATLRRHTTAIMPALATSGILAHVVLRYGLHASATTYRIPLVRTLVVGGAPMLYELLQNLLKREFGSDLLGGISVVTSVMLGEYLAALSLC